MRKTTRTTYDTAGNELSVEEIDAIAYVSPEEFIARFTPAEQAAISQSTDLNVTVVRNRLFSRTDPIDLDSTDVVQALLLFTLLGLIAPGRSVQIQE